MVNKTISMTISEIVKSSDQFKKTHKIKVSGPYDDEDIPKWFKIYAEKTDARLERLEERLEESQKWFKEYAERTDARLQALEEKFERFQNEPPKWFTDFANEVNKKFDFIFDQFEKHGWIKK